MTDRFDVRHARLNAGMTQRQLAKACGVSLTVIQRLETTDGTAFPGNAKKVADYFGIKATDLMPIEREAA